jgi:hypothetical protein
MHSVENEGNRNPSRLFRKKGGASVVPKELLQLNFVILILSNLGGRWLNLWTGMTSASSIFDAVASRLGLFSSSFFFRRPLRFLANLAIL